MRCFCWSKPIQRPQRLTDLRRIWQHQPSFTKRDNAYVSVSPIECTATYVNTMNTAILFM